MDPFIDPDALDPDHPLTHRKLENLQAAEAAYQTLATEVDALPSKVTLQTNETCNLACPHCQIPQQEKQRQMHPSLLETLETRLLPDLIELHPTNLGEPLMWKEFRTDSRSSRDASTAVAAPRRPPPEQADPPGAASLQPSLSSPPTVTCSPA